MILGLRVAITLEVRVTIIGVNLTQFACEKNTTTTVYDRYCITARLRRTRMISGRNKISVVKPLRVRSTTSSS
jgi:hypothetical protein